MVAELVGVGFGVGETVGEAVGLGVGLGVADAVAEVVGLGVGLGEAVAEAVGLGVGFGVGEAVGGATTGTVPRKVKLSKTPVGVLSNDAKTAALGAVPATGILLAKKFDAVINPGPSPCRSASVPFLMPPTLRLKPQSIRA